MLKPTKYTNLSLSVLNISSCLLKEIKMLKTILYDDLLELLVSKVGEGARHMFVIGLDFLYLLGLVDYDHKTDTPTFRSREEVI